MDLIDLIPESERPLLDTTGVVADAYMTSAIAAGEGIIRLPRGLLTFDEPIHLKHRVRLVGEGGGLAGSAVSEMRFAPNIDGIVVHRGDTGPNGLDTPPTTAADGAAIEGVKIKGSGTQGHGVWFRARAELRNSMVDGFGGDGIHIVATANSSDPFRVGNANGWLVDTVRIRDCGGNGLYIDGADVNAGTSIHVDATGNDGWGIYDSSFLGNTHISPHAAANSMGSYKTDNINARSVFVGAYAELNQPDAQFAAKTLILGGSGLNASGGLRIGDGGITPFAVIGPNGVRYEYGTIDSAMTAKAPGDHGKGWEIMEYNAALGVYEFRHARLMGGVVFRLTTNTTPLINDETGEPLFGGKLLMDGLWYSVNGRYRRLDFADVISRLEALEAAL